VSKPMAIFRWVVAGCVLTWTVASFAANAPSEVEAAVAEEQGQSAAVEVDGRFLFRVRGFTAFPAEVRAERIADNIAEVASDPAIAPDELRVEVDDGLNRIMGGSILIMNVLDADAELEGIDRATLTRAVLIRTGEAIVAWRADRAPERLRQNILAALAATLVLAATLWLVHRLFRWLRRLRESRVQRRVRDVQIAGFRIVRAQQINSVLAVIQTVLWTVFVVAAIYFYLSSVLALFPLTRGFASDLVALVVNPLRTIFGGFLDAVPNLVFLGVLFLVVRYVLKLIRLYFQGLGDGTLELHDFDREWALPTYRLVRIALVAFSLVIAYPYIPGSGSEAFKGISIFLGVLFSLGSSTIIGNVIAGYTLTYRRVFKPGDRVRIGEHLGDVHQTRVLVTYLRTPKNEVVAIPNSSIVAGEVVNYSSLAKEEGLILHTTVGIGYETPWRQVEAMLLEAAARTPGIDKEPRPFVLQKLLGDFCVTYEINGYTPDAHKMNGVYTDLHRNILDVFNEYGVQIMTPAYEGDPQEPKIVPREQWFAAPASQAPAIGSAQLGSVS
jgi:small-conductance mechanosensitive channel